MPTRDDEDFAREIAAHLELEADRLRADGLAPVEARRAARRAFGNVTAARERFHEASRWIWFEQLIQDLIYGCRTLRHSPAFATTTVLTLAIGLALTTGVFTVFNAYVLREFAVRDPGNLHQVIWHARAADGRTLRWRDYEAIRDRRDLFSDAIAESTRYVSSKGRPLAAELVSGNYFSALGPEMFLGRPLGPEDENGNAVVLGYQAWATVFARDRSAIGREIDLNGRRFVVVGVLGPGFAGLHFMPRDIWIPLRAYAATAPDLVADDTRAIAVSVRLHPGITRQQAQSAMTPLVADAAGRDRQARAEIRPQDKPTPLSLTMLALLSPVFAAFALVLVAGCANVSSVMLARAVARQREIAVRLSLGASRGRILRQLLTEGFLISMLAAGVSLALTAAGLRAGLALFFGTLPPSLAAILRTAPLAIDHRVFLFALAASAASTLAFALIPALQASRVALTRGLGAYGTGGPQGSGIRSALVAGQVAISLLLVVPALSMARNGAIIRGVDLGFDITDVISIHVRQGDAVELVRRLAAAMASEPRVAQFAVSNGNPLFGPPPRVPLDSQDARVPTPFNFVSPEYFATLRIPILRGRGFRQDEAATEARVAIVSAATARAFWPGQDPIGKTLRIAASTEQPGSGFERYSEVTIVGTSGDVISGLVVDGPEAGHLYLPVGPGSRHARAILARGRAHLDLSPEPVQQILRRAAADPEVFEALPLDEVRTLQIYPFMAASWIGALLGLIALALSISGLFGVLTYTFTQRSNEIGIRMALGATAGAVVRMVLRQTAWLTSLGAIVGLAGAFVLLQILGATIRMRAVSLLDGAAFGAGLALVVAAAAIAAYQPARRAARVDPAQTLRADS